MRYVVLIGQIRRELHELGCLVQQTSTLLQKVIRTGDLDYLGTVALNLHGFYSGAENIFREIAREVDDAVPEGDNWHRRLLKQMSAEIPAVRPAVLSDTTRTVLDDYCAFRHVVRNVYTFNLRPARLQELATALPDCYDLLSQDLETFCQLLAAIDGSSL